ncbi:DUF1993 domain-containing protein [uncultured Reyranella sp.]|jgi:hypothetical protein|uniref:DUF1993 domain-containing protein n=1 Tax=uncultured Reyranella sp. TaxID=735512 RepID=UPI00259D2290|nr:DUF1993 domain-containing protein [uncultured Reyranella sp.]
MIHTLVVGQFSKMLGNLLEILNEAEKNAGERKFDVAVLLHARLAPDQFDLMQQVRIACDTAKLGAARLASAEKDAPVHADTEATLAEIKARIESTVAYLKGFTAQSFAGAAERRITQPRWNGKSLSGEEFLVQHVIPNFYFHVTTTYAILRHNGVPVGKKNYLGAMPYRDAA